MKKVSARFKKVLNISCPLVFFIGIVFLLTIPLMAKQDEGSSVLKTEEMGQSQKDFGVKLAPDGPLFLVPNDLTEINETNSVFIHNYGPQSLVIMPAADSLSMPTRGRITELEDSSVIGYRSWSGSVQQLSKDSIEALPDGYYLVALVGPMDQVWYKQIENLGIAVLDTAPPYGLVVRADGSQLLRAIEITTFFDFSLVRGIIPMPIEARLDPELLQVLKGKSVVSEIAGARKHSDGRVVARFMAYRDRKESDVLAAVRKYADIPDPALDYGYGDTILIKGSEIETMLKDIESIAYLEVMHERTLHNNIVPLTGVCNVTPEWTNGWIGTGVIVDHNDSGIDRAHADLPASAIQAYYGTMSGTDNAHGTHTAGSVLGRGLAGSSPTNSTNCGLETSHLSTIKGMAYGAKLVTNNIFDGGYTTETTMMQYGYGQGARISTNSWGYSTYTYASYSATIDGLVRDASTSAGNQDFAILFSAGNDGSGASTVSSPGTAKNVITLGASQNSRCGSYVPDYQSGPNINTVATFSSRGPSQGRIKPDVCAPGTDVISVDSADSQATNSWDETWTGNYYAIMPGTSMSCPLTAGMAADFFQFYNTTYGELPKPALVKAALINGSVTMGTYGYPSNTQGWGRVNLVNTIEGPSGGSIVFVNQDDVTPLATGASWTQNFSVNNSSIPLKVTLVWTDPPGAASCTSCLKNNLNLIVTGPSGTYYHGNQFTSSWSTANASAYDTANNVENVFIQTPATGTWTIQVTSANTAENPPNLSGQDFAVVYSGGLGAAGCSMTVNVTPDGTSTVCANSSITFTATPSGGTSPYTYQWTEDGVNISGATSSTRAVTKTTAQSHTYNCKVSDSGSCDDITDATASTGTWVAAPTSVDVTPNGTTSVTVCGNILFTATVTGGASPQYQWTENGSNISGATGSTYTASKSAAGTFTYNCKVNNTGCSTTVQDATASTGTWTALGAPVITSVTDVTACAQSGVQVNFTSGSGAASHDLYRDGSSVVTGYTSGETYNPGDSSSHSYVVRAINGSCYTASNSMNGTDVNNSTTPTISGAASNTCPATTVALSTQNGMSSYQWYLGGSPIVGANAYQYTATASGSYTVSYTNGSGCTATSAAHVVTISACAPNIVYSTHGTFTQITGNGDSYYDLGEKWSVQVTLQNAGNVAATNVTATLSGNGIEVCEPVQPFGSMAVSGTASATYEFVISSTFTPCGGTIGFDVTTKTSTELTPAGADETDVFSITVGQGGAGVVTLFGPDDAPYTSGSWTWGGGSTQTAVHCSHTDAYGRLNQDTYCTLNTGLVSTVGYTNIQVTFDWTTFNMDTGGTDYLLLQYYNGTAWVDSGFSTYQNSWTCGQTVTLPAGAEGVSNFQIRFRAEGNSASSNERAGIDYVSITGNGGSADCSYVGSGTCEVCVTPGTPVINSVTDLSACAQSGVQVNYTANTPYTTHDLYVDGSLEVSDYVSGATYNPGDTASHDYVVRAVNGLDTCFADSSEAAGTDANSTPATPTATNNGPVCAGGTLNLYTATVSGATYSWTGPNGFNSLLEDPSIASATAAATGTYSVTVTVGGCTSAAGTTNATVNALPTPSIGGANANTCPAEYVNLTATGGMATYQWYLDGSPVGTGASTYQATASGSYTVFVTDANGCGGTSAPHVVTITPCVTCDPPGDTEYVVETINSDKTGFKWANLPSTPDSYRVIRALRADLATMVFTCIGTRGYGLNSTTGFVFDATEDDSQGVDGRCYYYIVQGYDCSDPDEYLGPAGDGVVTRTLPATTCDGD